VVKGIGKKVQSSYNFENLIQDLCEICETFIKVYGQSCFGGMQEYVEGGGGKVTAFDTV
jgi:hypothetical protein